MQTNAMENETMRPKAMRRKAMTSKAKQSNDLKVCHSESLQGPPLFLDLRGV